MTFLTTLLGYTLQNTKSLITNTTATSNLACVRYASKKASGSSRNNPRNIRPKHRGVRVQDGKYVQGSTILAVQLRPRFHPGLYVGMGRNGTLYAIERGTVVITCEKINPNMDHPWAKMNYEGREQSVIYKKHFNIIPEPHHDRFVLVDTV